MASDDSHRTDRSHSVRGPPILRGPAFLVGERVGDGHRCGAGCRHAAGVVGRQVLVRALVPEDRSAGPAWCTRRGHLWVQLLERWQSISWGLVAVRPRVGASEAARVSDLVAGAGAVIAAEAAAVPVLERRRAVAACLAAGSAVPALGPGMRRKAGLARDRAAGPQPRHRAKLAITQSVHSHLRQVSRTGGWSCADYAGAVTSLAACLTLHDPQPARETAALTEALGEAQTAARTLRELVEAAGPLEPEAWAHLAAILDRTRVAVDALGTRPAQPPAEPQALTTHAFLALGWAAAWGVEQR